MKDKLDLISFFQLSKEDNSYDFTFFCLTILICSIPLPNAFGNLITGILMVNTLYRFTMDLL